MSTEKYSMTESMRGSPEISDHTHKVRPVGMCVSSSYGDLRRWKCRMIDGELNLTAVK